MTLFLVKLSDNDKKILLLLALLLVIFILLLGWFVLFIKSRMARYGKGIDTYMADALKYGAIKNPRQFRRYVRQKETKHVVKKLLLPFYLGIIVAGAFYLWGPKAELWDALGSLGWNFKFEPIENTYFWNLGSIIPKAFPQWIKVPVRVDGNAFLCYIVASVTLLSALLIVHNSLVFLSRLLRAQKMSHTVFASSLEDVHYESR